MAGKGYLTFDEFKEHIVDAEGKPNDAGMNKIDAIIASKILGKKVKLGSDNVSYLRVEPPSEQNKKGGSFKIKQYTRNSEALEEVIEEMTAGEIQVLRYYNNALLNGQKTKNARYHVIVQAANPDGTLKQVEQKGNGFSMKIVTIAALLRWRGILLAPGQKVPDEPAQ